MRTRHALTLIAFLAAAHTVLAQGAPASKAPATKAPATKAPAAKAPDTKALVTKAPATKEPATQAPVTQAPATQAPATKAPATQEQPSLFTRIKRAVGLEKAPVAAPAAPSAPATKQDTTKPDAKATSTKASAIKSPGTKAPATMTPAAMTPATKAAATKAADTKAAAPVTKGAAPQTRQGGLTVAPEAAPQVKVPVIMREVFQYESEARRDPFFSLLTTSELRPALVDLRLTGVILDPSGRRSVAIMRDVKDNTQYRVTTGMQLGRMRVALIKARAVIFSIEEFGLNRQDSLVLGDTTKVRAK